MATPITCSWAGMLSLLQDSVEYAVEKTVQGFASRLKDVFGDRSLRLKLMCEHCKTPAEPGYQITRVSEKMVKLLPLMKVGLAAPV